MTYCTRVQLRIGFLVAVAGAVLSPTAGAKSATEPSICTGLVAQMRRSPATVVKDNSRQLEHPESLGYDHWMPWITTTNFRVSSDSGAFRGIDSEWATHRKTPSPPGLTSVEALPGTGLFVANAILGSGDCLHTMFVDWKRGSHLRVIPKPQLGLDLCGRDNNPAWANPAMVLGQPAYIGSRSLNETNGGALMIIARWNGKGWAPPCPVSIRFTYRYTVTLLYCGASRRVCNAARRLTPEATRRYEEYESRVFDALNDHSPVPKFDFHRNSGAQGRLLVARARRIGIPKRVLPASAAPPVWLRHLNPVDAEYFPLRVDGKMYVGAADIKVIPSSGPSPLVFVFRAPRRSARRLIPLAVLAAQRVTSGVKSIQARNESPSSSAGS